VDRSVRLARTRHNNSTMSLSCMRSNVLDYWDLTSNELTEIVGANPSLRGIIEGYIAEYKLKRMLLSSGKIADIGKYDNHDREKRGDLFVMYKKAKIGIEVKSLQTATITEKDGKYVGRFQCDASDRRTVVLPTGDKIETTCLVVGEFDVLAVSLFGFLKQWKFAFAKNQELPRSKYRRYSEEQRKHLLKTLVKITYPLEAPFKEDPFKLLDEIGEERTSISS